MQVCTRLDDTLGVTLSLRTLFEQPTLSAFAAAVARVAPDTDWRPAQADTSVRTGPLPLFCAHLPGGNVLAYRLLARYMLPDQPIYVLEQSDTANGRLARMTVEEMAAECLPALRSVQPTGPYYLCGFSSAGVVVFEMARQLQAQGESVALLVLIDSFCPPMLDAPDVGPLRMLGWRLRYHAMYWARLESRQKVDLCGCMRQRRGSQGAAGVPVKTCHRCVPIRGA